MTLVEAIFNRGDQILNVPVHAEGNPSHPDCEMGFVTSVRGEDAFCRYWRKGEPGELRTTANSELTPLGNLMDWTSVPQSTVDFALRFLCG